MCLTVPQAKGTSGGPEHNPVFPTQVSDACLSPALKPSTLENGETSKFGHYDGETDEEVHCISYYIESVTVKAFQRDKAFKRTAYSQLSKWISSNPSSTASQVQTKLIASNLQNKKTAPKSQVWVLLHLPRRALRLKVCSILPILTSFSP
jgi:hypothetical protein